MSDERVGEQLSTVDVGLQRDHGLIMVESNDFCSVFILLFFSCFYVLYLFLDKHVIKLKNTKHAHHDDFERVWLCCFLIVLALS